MNGRRHRPPGSHWPRGSSARTTSAVARAPPATSAPRRPPPTCWCSSTRTRCRHRAPWPGWPHGPTSLPDALVVGRRGHVDLTGWSARDTVDWLAGRREPPSRRPDPAWLDDGYRATRRSARRRRPQLPLRHLGRDGLPPPAVGRHRRLRRHPRRVRQRRLGVRLARLQQRGRARPRSVAPWPGTTNRTGRSATAAARTTRRCGWPRSSPSRSPGAGRSASRGRTRSSISARSDGVPAGALVAIIGDLLHDVPDVRGTAARRGAAVGRPITSPTTLRLDHVVTDAVPAPARPSRGHDPPGGALAGGRAASTSSTPSRPGGPTRPPWSTSRGRPWPWS